MVGRQSAPVSNTELTCENLSQDEDRCTWRLGLLEATQSKPELINKFLIEKHLEQDWIGTI